MSLPSVVPGSLLDAWVDQLEPHREQLRWVHRVLCQGDDDRFTTWLAVVMLPTENELAA